jgi:hypothetical protein
MKPSALLLLLAAVLPNTVRADLTIVQKVDGIGMFSQITTKLKGDKVRVEVSPEMAAIIDNKTGEIINVMNSQKKFIRLSADQSKAIAGMASKYGDTGAETVKPKLKASGKKETINGYETDEYVRESPTMKESYWIALKYPDSAAIVKQLQSITPAAWNNIAKGMFDYRDFPGLPLRTIVKTEGREIVSTIVSIKQDPVSEAEFIVPKDYEELKVPNLKEMFSEKPQVPPANNP